jgi:hypothetical protein
VSPQPARACTKRPNKGVPRGWHCCLTAARFRRSGSRGGVPGSAPRAPGRPVYSLPPTLRLLGLSHGP